MPIIPKIPKIPKGMNLDKQQRKEDRKARFKAAVKHLPQDYKDLAKETSGVLKSIVRAPFRAAGSTGASVGEQISEKILGRQLTDEERSLKAKNKVERLFLGDEPVRTISLQKERTQKFGQDIGLSEKTAKRLSGPLVFAGTLLDLIPGFGGAEKKIAQKTFTEIAASKEIPAIIKSLKNVVKGSDEEIKLLAKNLVDIKSPQQVEGLVKAYTGNIPLTKFENPKPGYESYVPEEHLGGGKYGEITYESPVKTSGGDYHPELGKRPNYFGHVRYTDLPDGRTSRMLENQSDLFQRDRLAQQDSHWNLLQPNENLLALEKRVGKEGYEKMRADQTEQLKQLQPYAKDFKAHLRQFKQFLEDKFSEGKNKIQFPTGKTAMKIEGLDKGEFKILEEGRPKLTTENMVVGKEIVNSNGVDYEVITEVLGDGKFKAINKRVFLDLVKGNKELTPLEILNSSEPRFKKFISDYSEMRDASPVEDKTQFIYRLNDTKMPKEAERLGYEVKKITSPEGEQYWEIEKKITPKEQLPQQPEIQVRPEPQLDEVIPSPSIVPQEKTAVQSLIDALKKAKPIRGKQEAIYSKERGKRLGQAMAEGKRIKGEAGLPAQLSKLKGEIPKVEFESLRKEIKQENIDELFESAKNSDQLSGFEKIRAQEALAKLFGEYGGQVPTRSEIALLERVFPKELIDELLDKRPLMSKIAEAGLQLANIPRALMSGFLDLSFGGRQGSFAAPRYRKEFYDSWKKQFKIFGSEKAYKASREALENHKDFELAKEAGISFTDVGRAISDREERFASQWAEKIPLIGRGIRATGRSYTAFANKFRMDIFSSMIKDAENLGLDPKNNIDLLKGIATFVNASTGRGSLGKLEDAAGLLNAFFFSPRLMASRLTLLNPVYYIRQDPFVRKEALKTLLTYGATASTILGLTSLIPGVTVGTDPRSADFGKIKIGNTRIDIGGGFQQYIRMAAQLISGEYVSTTTGKEYKLGEGYKPTTRYDILLRQIESKEAPIFSFITSILRQQDYAGQPISVQKELLERITPMIISDSYDLAKEDPSLLPLEVLAIFGASVQTYKPKDDKKKGSSGFPSVPKLPKLNVGPSIPKIPRLPKITR